MLWARQALELDRLVQSFSPTHSSVRSVGVRQARFMCGAGKHRESNRPCLRGTLRPAGETKPQPASKTVSRMQ